MKKVLAVGAVLALLSGSGWAQTTNIIPGLDITLTGKLIPSAKKVTGASLSGNTNAISFVHLQIINGTTTNLERWIGQINGPTTNLFLRQRGHVDFTPSAGPVYKFMLGFFGNGQVGTSSNAEVLVTGTEITKVVRHTTNLTVNATVLGIWLTGTDSDGGEEVAGTVATVKAK